MNPLIKQISYNDEVIKTFSTCQVFKHHQNEINSIDFSLDGLSLITSGKDDQLSLIDVERQEVQKKFFNKTFGVENAIFTQDKHSILCSSKSDFRIMYWCLHNNEVIFSFKGHSDIILDINKNPLNDTFLTTSKDNTSRVWDLKNRECLCILQDSNHAVFDNLGKVLSSVTSETDRVTSKVFNYINLYSVDSMHEGPFRVFKIEAPEIKQLKFSNNGDLLLGVTQECILIIDSFSGDVLGRLGGEISESDITLKAEFSPDSKYVVSGSEGGKVMIWNVEKKNLNNIEKINPFHTLIAHPQTSNCVKFSPKHALLASSCSNLALWIPVVN